MSTGNCDACWAARGHYYAPRLHENSEGAAELPSRRPRLPSLRRCDSGFPVGARRQDEAGRIPRRPCKDVFIGFQPEYLAGRLFSPAVGGSDPASGSPVHNAEPWRNRATLEPFQRTMEGAAPTQGAMNLGWMCRSKPANASRHRRQLSCIDYFHERPPSAAAEVKVAPQQRGTPTGLCYRDNPSIIFYPRSAGDGNSGPNQHRL